MKKKLSTNKSILIIISIINIILLSGFNNYSSAYDNKEVHPYICYQALLKLIEMESNAVNGTCPATLSNMAAEISSYLPTDVDYYYWRDNPEDITTGSYIMEGAKEEDGSSPLLTAGEDYNILEDILFYPANKLTQLYGFDHHFWDCDDASGHGFTKSEDSMSALSYAKAYWALAICNYYDLNGSEASSYYYLGRIAHLLADMSVPAHVHLDGHLSIEVLGLVQCKI